MARDLDVVRRYCSVGAEEERALLSPAAPIVLLAADGAQKLPDEVAPGLQTLGFMLPTTPLHLLMLRRCRAPGGDDQRQSLRRAAGRSTTTRRASGSATSPPYALLHDREIANRVDDSVVRVMAGRSRLLRRARGYAPAPIALPPGFEAAPELLAMGGELKATFCLVKDGEAILSQHQGDLENAETFDDYRKNLALYAELFHHGPTALAADRHPEYLSTKLANGWARTKRLPLIEAQHHHAHVAACLAENSVPLDAPPALGIVLDGLGWGDDGTIWGGEFLLADYRGFERLGAFKPVAMLGGAQAAREPWRNLYAHLMAEMGWAEFSTNFAGLELFGDLSRRPRATLDAMARGGVNSPKASSCGRLFDAVAAALDLCRERQSYEGEAGARLEAIVDPETMRREDDDSAYPFAIRKPARTPACPLSSRWRCGGRCSAISCSGRRRSLIAARFHKGLAGIVAAMAKKLARRDSEGRPRFDTVALSGGCFQNRILFEEIVRRLEGENFTVLSHAQVPANDGGLALGQAAIGAARLIGAGTNGRNSGLAKG